MIDMGRAAISSMNYIFLRSVFKEQYPESIKEELSSWLEYVAHSLDGNNIDDVDMAEALYDYAYQEIDEGDYHMLKKIPELIRYYLEEYTDLVSSQMDIVCDFYQHICDDIYQRREKEGALECVIVPGIPEEEIEIDQ